MKQYSILLLLFVGCTNLQPTPVAPIVPTTIVVYDTVTQYITDSAALKATIKYYQRERKKQNDIYSKNQYVYLKEIVKLDSTVAILRDSLVALQNKDRSTTAEAAQLRQQVAENTNYTLQIPPPEPDSIKEMRTRMEWLLTQERKIFTMGAEDAKNDVEVTHIYTDADKIYVAIRTGEAAQASAAMNEKQALFAYQKDNSQVFVFNYPQVDKIELNFTLNSRQYKIQTTLKTLLGKAIK